jgi:hypothetical protein
MDIKDVLEAYLGDLEYNASSLSRMNYATAALGILIPNKRCTSISRKLNH